ncbi:MAG: hypothetical protein IBJ10_01855, partial [Phycisphaerales bacterium]|nr:hypothetical protein [Phycisphaerales bacterium]
MDPIDRRMMLGAAGLAGVAAMTKLASAGPLSPPPGPVGATGQTLDDIYNRVARTDVGVAEPRIPVQSLPGSATALHVITEPGSYYLTGNIQGVAGKNGIEVHASRVDIDLSGFSMVGAAGSMSAVRQIDGLEQLSVHDGLITDWSEFGVYAFFSPFSRVERIKLARIVDRAVIVNFGSVVTDCSVRQCGGRTLSVESLGLIARCITDQCGSPSIYGQNRILVTDCVAHRSGQGVVVEGGGRIERCQAIECGLGIGGGSDTVVTGCVVSQAVVGISAAEGPLLELK